MDKKSVSYKENSVKESMGLKEGNLPVGSTGV